MKCAYGRDGWGAMLKTTYNERNQYAGLELDRPLDETEVQQQRAGLKAAREQQRKSETEQLSPARRKLRESLKANRNGEDKMELIVTLHAKYAATLDVANDRWLHEGTSSMGPMSARISAAWTGKPATRQLNGWLDGCLPENGLLARYRARAQSMLQAAGVARETPTVAEILRANADAEFAGAIRFDTDRTRTTAAMSGYERLTETEIGSRLDEADRIARGLGAPTRLSDGPEGIALSGMRGKIGLTMLEHGGWGAAQGQALNTWIAKVEDNPRLPGEAGIEAICQRTFALLGIDSAETASRVFDGVQTVLSRRSDRVGAPEAGNVRARHQEDMAQALGYPCALKYDAGWRTEPRWRECHRLLIGRATDPDAEHRRLTQILAATWLIGHSDLHRRNLGFVHAEDGPAPSITIAPLYDVSSARGLKNLDQTLAIGIARQLGLTRIRPRVWMTHATECGLDPEETIEIVRATARRMPDAVAQARDEARTSDENKAQASVDRRVTEILRYACARHRAFEQALAGMRRKNG